MSDTTADLFACGFFGNDASYPGGGLYADGSILSIQQGWFFENTALSGGGMRLNNTDASLRFMRFYANDVTDDTYPNDYDPDATGGGLAVSGGALDMSHAVISTNKGSKGGGLYMTGNAQATLEHLVVTNNGANGVGTGGMYFNSEQIAIRASIFAYNDGLNLEATDEEYSLSVTHCDFFAREGDPGTNLTFSDPTVMVVEPGFLSYGADGRPDDAHLSASSPLRDIDTAATDPDGSPSDLGVYGGETGDGWDLDRDGVPDYFWPGEWQDAPVGFDSANYDCDDLIAAPDDLCSP